jgi:hypothetical protein
MEQVVLSVGGHQIRAWELALVVRAILSWNFPTSRAPINSRCAESSHAMA